MIYLKLEDLNAFIKQNVIDDLTENNYQLLDTIEQMSIGEVDAHISFKFDTIAALKARHPFLIMLLIDVFAYHLSTRMTHVNMQDIVENRYEAAKDTLMDISNGKIVPNLPMKEELSGEYVSKNLFNVQSNMTSPY